MAKKNKKLAALKLPKPHNGCFRKCLGKIRGFDGKLRTKVFYLGSNAIIAERKLERIYIEWQRLKADGKDARTDEVLNRLDEEVGLQRAETNLTKADVASLLDTTVPKVDLAPFADDKGETQPDLAQEALD